MRKSGEISKDLEVLELEASNLFSELLKQKQEFNFLQALDFDGDDKYILGELKHNGEANMLPILEFRNDITGNTFDGYVCKVHENGIDVIEEDFTERCFKFSDLLMINDRLILLNEMEELLK
jgi:hypothetical protein